MYKIEDIVNKIHCADCLEFMKQIPSNSIDTLICDPPYGLFFMGKKWDYNVPSVETWKECLRVLKPGGYLLSFAGTRTQHRMAVNIEDAGFEIRDMIAWVYGSGFPKSLNIGKAIDKLDAVGIRMKRNYIFTKWMRSTGITAKQINDLTSSNMGNHYLTNKEQPSIATLDMFDKIKHLLSKPSTDIMQTKEIFKGGVLSKDVDITLPSTNEAKQWEGWGTALKPALEPITVARKPLSEKTVAENVLKWGTGGINIDGCRVSGDYKCSGGPPGFKPEKGWNPNSMKQLPERTTQGRFPANFIHDGSDEVVRLFPNTKSGSGVKGARPNYKSEGLDFQTSRKYRPIGIGGDSGSASRFFYCAKASKAERNRGCEGMKETSAPKYGAEKKITVGGSKNIALPRANNHPTVKPIALMEYLIKLVSRKGALILDPFGGSGSTGIACKNTGRKYILIEKEKEYCEIAKARISSIQDYLF